MVKLMQGYCTHSNSCPGELLVTHGHSAVRGLSGDTAALGHCFQNMGRGCVRAWGETAWLAPAC